MEMRTENKPHLLFRSQEISQVRIVKLQTEIFKSGKWNIVRENGIIFQLQHNGGVLYFSKSYLYRDFLKPVKLVCNSS